MSKKSVILVSFLIISPIILYFLWPTDENRIRKLFREGSRAVETEKLDEVMSKVSFTYSDEYGLSYMLLKNIMERTFTQMDNIRIEYDITQIEIKDKTATASIDLRVIARLGKEEGYVIGDAGKAVGMTFLLTKERTSWLVTGMKGLPSSSRTW